jgi:S-adenosylmethionine:tRNA ribosyltransferase-isomerase
LDVKDIKIQDYSYVLPNERIAKFPLQERDASKLLIYQKGNISESTYRHLADYIPADSSIFFNNTKVIPARLLFQNATGATIEIFCLEPTTELASSMTQQGNAEWLCIVGNAKRWKAGEILSLNTEGGIELKAKMMTRIQERFVIQFTWLPSANTFSEILSFMGQVPLPPYLNRGVEDSDKQRYQTIYAHYEGSVAAPTAGLHFTDNIFDNFKRKKIEPHYITLHVGAGTFKPVKSEVIADHDMHAEYFDMPLKTLKILLNAVKSPTLAGREAIGKKNIIAVGTTTLRTLESLYLMGCKISLNPQLTLEEATIKQWDAYETAFETITPLSAFEALIQWVESQNMERIVAKTQLLIAPPYRIRTVNALVTNFHQPQSTLLLLVAAFVGEDWRRIYDYALSNDFRFLSYGDGCLFLRDLDE